jgi:DME family drug/metabolite transporter
MRVSTSARAAARRRPIGLLCLVMSGLLWGTGGLTGSLLSRVAGLPAMSVAAYRLTAGGALIGALLMATGRRWPAGRAAWLRITGIGLLAAQFQACYFTAVSLTSVSLATLITVGSAPVIVLCVERVTTRRRTGRLKGGAACLALTGPGPPGWPSLRRSSPRCPARRCGHGSAGRDGIRRGHPDRGKAGTRIGRSDRDRIRVRGRRGGPDGADGGDGRRARFQTRTHRCRLLIALGAGPTAIAYTLYFRGLRTTAASTAALLALLGPLTGAILAALILGDRLGAAGITGMAILAAAMILTARSHRRELPVEVVSGFW